MIGSVRLMPHIINICILIRNETKLIDELGFWKGELWLIQGKKIKIQS